MRLQLALRNLKTTQQMSGTFKLQGNFVCYLLSYWLKILNQLKFFACSGTRTTVAAEWSLFFHRNPKLVVVWADNLDRIVLGDMEYFQPIHRHIFWYMFAFNRPIIFYKKLSLIFLFGIGIWIWIWATKNQGFTAWPEAIWIKVSGWWQIPPQHQSTCLRGPESASIEIPLFT